VQADCKQLGADVAVAEKVPWPADTEAKSAWSQGVALLLQASERCSTLVTIASGAQADSVINTAGAGKEGLSLVAQELRSAAPA
jgi:hypothetical protein